MTMTFEKLFNDAINNIDNIDPLLKEVSGKNDAYDLFLFSLEQLLKPIAKKVGWDKVEAFRSFDNVPIIRLTSHKVYSNINIKIKLKTNGKLFGEYGPMKYIPVKAETTTQKLMTMDVEKYLKSIYKNDIYIKERIKEEKVAKTLIAKHQDLFDQYIKVVNEINNLPNVGLALKHIELPKLVK